MVPLDVALIKEQARVRNILEHYKQVGPPGLKGAAKIEQSLKRADKSFISRNVEEMTAAYEELRGIKS